MTLGPELQQLVDAARELDAEPPDIEGRMWAAISAAVGPGATPSPAPEADVSASPSGAVSTLPTVIKGAALGLAGIGLAVGIARVIPSETASGRALAGPVAVAHARPRIAAEAPMQRFVQGLATPLVDEAEARPRPPATNERSSEAPRRPRVSTARPEPAVDADGLAEETRLLRRARASVAAGDPSHALTTLAEHAERFPRGALREARMALEVEALCGAGRTDDAERASQRLRRAFPRSALRKETWCTR